MEFLTGIKEKEVLDIAALTADGMYVSNTILSSVLDL